MINWYRIAKEEKEDDYKGLHTAPEPEGSVPLYDLSGIYPDDIYSSKGAIYYGHYGQGAAMDIETMGIIHNAHGKPNYSVMIYRAVPDVNKGLRGEISKLRGLLGYFNRFQFYPVGDEVVGGLRDKYKDLEYDERERKIYEDIDGQVMGLEGGLKKDIGINIGDWVTINRRYAKEHGESLLMGEYRIVSKRVRARDLYTDGESIQEWGYYPS